MSGAKELGCVVSHSPSGTLDFADVRGGPYEVCLDINVVREEES